MATKNCPHCSKQVPVACKKCGCGHTFFVTRKSATSVNRENCEEEEMPSSPPDESKPTRRSGRVTRERPNFYDALQYENQTRRDKQMGETQESPHFKDCTFPNIFVTVGSTRFDDLVNLILSDKNTLAQFHEWGTNSVVVQKGSSSVEGGLKDKFIKQKIHFTIYDYKPSLAEDMKKADLIICHAGAGTTMEALDLLKPVIVIPNRNLMDDHQLELASKLQEGNHAFLSGVLSFHKDAKEVKKSWFKPMPPRRTQEFVDYLSHCFFGPEIKN